MTKEDKRSAAEFLVEQMKIISNSFCNIDDEKLTIMSENEQLHMQLQEMADENEALKNEIKQYLPEGNKFR